jgi:hypothetical protein
MKCLECQELLQRRLDGESIASAALEQHLLECASCREQHLAVARLLEGLKELPSPQTPAGLPHSLTATILRDRRQRRDKLRRQVFLTAALAASVMLVLFLAYYWMPRPDGAGKNIAKEQPKHQDPPRPTPIPEQRDETPKNNIVGLPERWVETTRDHAKVLQVAMNLDNVQKLPVENLPLDPVREAGQEVSDGVRTVTRNARKAFDFFAREIPMPDMGAH